MKTRVFSLMVFAGGALWLAGAAAAAQDQPEPEWPPVVKRLSGKELPAALRLSSFVSKTDKAVKFDKELAKQSLEGHGLELTDSDLELFISLYGDFDEDQGRRHERILREHEGQPEKIREAGEFFLLERAEFTGGVLGAWLAHLREQGHDTGRFLVHVAESSTVSFFWGGRPPTVEGLEREAAAFAKAFREEYGMPLHSVLAGEGKGGGR